MRRIATKFISILLAISLAAACQGAPASLPNTLLVVKVPQVSLEGGAGYWENAPKLGVATVSVRENGLAGPVLTLQAVYDKDKIALRAEWGDPTASVYKNAWTWDGNVFDRSGDEDRLMIHFPISNDPEFASKGCAAACHNQEEDAEKWYMATERGENRLDQWHWKSTRTNPIDQADDKWLGIRANPADTESGHYGDEKESGGEAINENERRNSPAYQNGVDVNSPFILAGQEAPLDLSALSPGMIPGYILSPITGSRGDLGANGTWADGKWVVVIVRALDTGHDDDVVFTPPKLVPFGVAITDNAGGYNHTASQEVLVLAWK